MNIRMLWDIFIDSLYSGFRFHLNEAMIDSEEESGLSYLTPRAWHIYSILNTLDVYAPKSNRSFMKNVRHMHKYEFALSFINSYGDVTQAYAEEMVAKRLITPQIEEIYIRQKYNRNLIYYVNDAGHKWSYQAKKLIKKLCPRETYNHFFKK